MQIKVGRRNKQTMPGNVVSLGYILGNLIHLHFDLKKQDQVQLEEEQDEQSSTFLTLIHQVAAAAQTDFVQLSKMAPFCFYRKTHSNRKWKRKHSRAQIKK